MATSISSGIGPGVASSPIPLDGCRRAAGGVPVGGSPGINGDKAERGASVP